MQVEVRLLPPRRHHHESAQRELAPRRFHTCAARLEVGECVVEADIFLAVQVEVCLTLVVAVDCRLKVKGVSVNLVFAEVDTCTNPSLRASPRPKWKKVDLRRGSCSNSSLVIGCSRNWCSAARGKNSKMNLSGSVRK